MKYKAKTEARNTQNRAVRTSVMICFTVLITLSAGEQIKTMPKMSSGEEAFSLSMGKAETKYFLIVRRRKIVDFGTYCVVGNLSAVSPHIKLLI